MNETGTADETSQILKEQMISLLLTTKRTTEDHLLPDHNNELERAGVNWEEAEATASNRQ